MNPQRRARKKKFFFYFSTTDLPIILLNEKKKFFWIGKGNNFFAYKRNFPLNFILLPPGVSN